ncbi:MAG: (d)CMP kinase [Armatimonadetes bacterium]|nr:(d)CMP kinase [Armatimonadota bacterium]
MNPHIQVAIDGPAGTGKSTVAKRAAEALGYTFVDSGAMYRCVALAALRAGLSVEQADAIGGLAARVSIRLGPLADGKQPVWLDGEDATAAIRTPEVTALSSPVSAIPAVRAALTAQQRAFAEQGPVVMEGRDIQTVVLPHAEVKVYLSASPEVRAERRYRELRPGSTTVAAVAAAIRERDERDSTRANAPLKPADDAVVIDTDPLSVDEVAARVVALARAAEEARHA